MVERKEYLGQLIGWKEEQVIKVVTGIRRCKKHERHMFSLS